PGAPSARNRRGPRGWTSRAPGEARAARSERHALRRSGDPHEMRRVPGEARQRVRGERLEVPVEEAVRREVGVAVSAEDVAQTRRRPEQRGIAARPDAVTGPVDERGAQ